MTQSLWIWKEILIHHAFHSSLFSFIEGSSVESLTINLNFKNMMFMGRIMNSKASHKNFQEHLLISRGFQGIANGVKNLVRQTSEMPLCKFREIAEEDEDFGGMEFSQAESKRSKWIREKHFKWVPRVTVLTRSLPLLWYLLY